MLEIARESALRGGKVPRLLHVDEVGPERQHHGGLYETAMDADRAFFFRDQIRRIAETRPAGRHRQHAVAHSQFRRHDGHQRRISAMRVQHHELSYAAFGRLPADADPALDRLFVGQASATRKIQMFGGVADLFHRQESHLLRMRQLCRQPRRHAASDDRIRLERQMRAVLLRRAQRQQGDFGSGYCFAGCHLSEMSLCDTVNRLGER